jgi:hypothetical protein
MNQDTIAPVLSDIRPESKMVSTLKSNLYNEYSSGFE